MSKTDEFTFLIRIQGQLRSPDMRPSGRVDKQPSTAGLLQGGQLQIRVLIPSRNAGVAEVHNPILSLIYGTDK